MIYCARNIIPTTPSTEVATVSTGHFGNDRDRGRSNLVGFVRVGRGVVTTFGVHETGSCFGRRTKKKCPDRTLNRKKTLTINGGYPVSELECF